ncbi:unnamed protein product [Spirodela intermedia]|uniref:Uncharacterized protein n=1 Tax=Spirodela intermedia TaxID=51605 RepID=A0A7I8JB82_SPIIN|nr:unnamed protein product [Spirodela intermedia]CAA6667466.1 unnamed protein product [Spirodela intermedia]
MKRAREGKGQGQKRSVFIRIVKAPLWVLCQARDLYVSSMTGCAGRVNYGAMASFSFQQGRSSCSSEDDLRELMRAASQGAKGSLNRGGPGIVPRSQSVGIGRIDEDKPCEFGAEAMAGPFYPGAAATPCPPGESP